jgi:hypothetical protein
VTTPATFPCCFKWLHKTTLKRLLRGWALYGGKQPLRGTEAALSVMAATPANDVVDVQASATQS